MMQENCMDIKKLKESRTIEFKSSFGKEVIISLVAFANTRGGKVVLGIDDKGKVTGIELGSEIFSGSNCWRSGQTTQKKTL
jgi:ATP-dependent DNA helicase RecG